MVYVIFIVVDVVIVIRCLVWCGIMGVIIVVGGLVVDEYV